MIAHLRAMTLDDILGGICIAVLLAGLPLALPILTELVEALK